MPITIPSDTEYHGDPQKLLRLGELQAKLITQRPAGRLSEAVRDPRLLGSVIPWWPAQLGLLDMLDDENIRTHVWALGRQSGKTSMAAALAIHNATLRPDLDEILPRGRVRYILVLGASQRQSREFIRLCRGMLAQVPLLEEFLADPLTERLGFHLPGGREVAIMALPSAPSSLRGLSASLVILDEFAHLNDLSGPGSDEQAYAAVTPALRAFGPLAKRVLISTPDGRTNKFFELFEQAGSGDLEHSQAVQGTVHEIVPDIDEGFLTQARAELGESLYAQEYLADFIASGGAFFDLSRIEFEESAAFPEECDMWMGALDPAFHADSFGYALIGRSRAEPGRWLLGPVGGVKPEGEAKSFDARRGREDRTLAEVFERLSAYGPVKLFADQHQAVAIESYFGQRSIHVEIVNVTGNIQTAAFTSLRARLQDGSLRAWRESQLIEELRRVRAKDGGKIGLPHFGDSHCDSVMALALAVYGADMGGGMPMLTVGPSLSTGRTPRPYGPSEFS